VAAPAMVLSEIWLYPIKSASGISVSEAPVDLSGPTQDRRWMLIDDDGVFLSQRKLPRMALLRPRFQGRHLIVEAPGMTTLWVRGCAGDDDRVPARIWHDELLLPHPDPAYDTWFSRFLGQSCRLVHLPANIVRPVEPPYDASPWQVSLADAYPLLLIGQPSLDFLNSQSPTPIQIQRFRPNLVVTGAIPHEEDRWRRIRIGRVELAIVKPCARCSIPLVDPSTSERGIEPLRTLARYRRQPRKVTFGQNALVLEPGLLRAGDPVEVLESVSRASGSTKP